jgi:hypothetical protein
MAIKRKQENVIMKPTDYKHILNSTVDTMEKIKQDMFPKNEIKKLSKEDKKLFNYIEIQSSATLIGLSQLLKHKKITKQELVDAINETIEEYSLSLQDIKEELENKKIAEYYKNNDYSSTYIR